MGKRPPSPWLAFVKKQMNLEKNAGKLLKDVLKTIDRKEYEVFKKTFDPSVHKTESKKHSKSKKHRKSKKHHKDKQRGGEKETPDVKEEGVANEGPTTLPSEPTNDGSGDNNMKAAPTHSQLDLISGTSSSTPALTGGKKKRKTAKKRKSKMSRTAKKGGKRRKSRKSRKSRKN